jgi:23S rRNA (uracil1939-C5)-methyltransferase
VTRVADAAGPDPIIDLSAGAGLFALTLVASGRKNVTAVEGDPDAARDLDRNAAVFDGAVQVVHAAVEDYLAGAERAGTVIADPPRSGLSRVALDRLVRLRAERVVYVSCDVATFARDLKKLLTAGYSMTYLTAFDLFPNTAHIELLGVLHAGVPRDAQEFRARLNRRIPMTGFRVLG